MSAEGDLDPDDPRTIRVDEFLPHPREKVWRALTEPDLLARWFMPGDFEAIVGHRFTLRTNPKRAVRFGGVVHGEVLAVEPPRLLSYTFVDPGEENGLDSVVTFRLEPEGRGTRLFLEHDGFDPDNPIQQLSRTIMGGEGWRRTACLIDQLLTERAADEHPTRPPRG